jgi:hypothetical protein
MLRRQPVMAQSGPAETSAICSLSGVNFDSRRGAHTRSLNLLTLHAMKQASKL